MSKNARSPRTARPGSSHRGWRRHHVAAATLALLGTGGNAAPVNWVGADGGFWDATGNWDAGQPGASADVQLLAFNTTLRSGNYGIRSLAGTGRLTLSGGALSFNEASSLGSMLLSGGTLGGGGTLLVSGASEWQRGAFGGTGAATFSGGLSITGQDLHDILNKRLELAGTSTWTNASTYYQGQIRMGGGAVMANSGTFLDQIANDTTINAGLGGAATFINSGTYTKTGVGTTTVQTVFNNTGTVNGTGLLVLSGGGTHTGNFAMDAGGTVQINGGTHTFGGTDTTGGAGRLLLSSGATATAGGGSMSTQARWDLQGGAISGAGTLALDGAASWVTTTMTAGSHTRFGGALAIVGDGYRDVNGASITFAGTSTWTNASTYYQGQIRSGNGATLTNTGTFIDATVASTSINKDLGGSATFVNSGTYQKTTGSTTSISTAFDNTATGTIQLDAGALQLTGGGTGGGHIDVASGATLAFAGGTHTISGWTGGAGTGRVLVSAGTVNASGSNTLTGRVAVSGGVLNASGTLNTGGFDMSGGTLGGSGALDLNLAAGSTGAWVNGVIARSGTTTVTGPLTISGDSLHDVNGGRLVLAGTSTWTNGSTYYQGQFRLGSAAVIDNSGSFLDQIAISTSINGSLAAGGGSFTNSGTYTKTGAGTTTVQTAFNNTGTVNGTGLLVLSGGGTHTGNFAMDAGGTVQLNGGTHSFGGTDTTGGEGRLLLSNGATVTAGGGSMSTQARWDLLGGTISGAGTLALNGIANWTGTALSGGSHTSFSGALAIVGDGYRDVNGASVTFAGTTTWTNAATFYQGQMRTGNGATLNNTGSFIDATVASSSINRDLGASATFINSGTYQKTTGSTTTISTAFDNTPSGVIQLDAGTLQLAGGGNGGGQIDVASGATLAFAGGTHSVSGWTGGAGTGRVLVSAGAVNASGSNTLTGRVAISGGALNASGTFNTGGLDMSGGTLGGSGPLALNLAASSTGAWTGGSIARSGTTTLTGPLAISGDSLHDVYGGRLVLAGTSTWSNAGTYYQGQFRMGGAAVIDNSGSFLDQIANSTTINDGLGGGAGTFINSGTYTKSGVGTTTVQTAFNNTGTVNGTGLLVLSGNGTHTGSFAMDEGGTVQLAGGTHGVSGHSTAGGLGRVLLSAGVLTTATAMSTTGRWDLEAGTVQGAGEMAFDGVTNWSGGTQAEAGSTRFGGALALVGNGYRDVSQRTVTFAGSTTWTNSGTFYQGRFRTGSGARLVNSGNFFDQTAADTQIANDLGGAASSFANSGSYIKSGGSLVNIAIASTNTGTLRVSGGVLSLSGGLSNFAGSTLTGGTYEVFGPGTLQFTGANVVTNAATVLLDGAGSQLRNASNGANALTNIAANTAAGRFTIQNGRNLTTLGAFNNEGWVQVGDASTFTSAGVFNNAAGATLQMAGGSFAGPTVPNAGQLSGFGNVAPAVANTGAVRASGGTLTLAGGVQGAGGAVFIDTGATLALGAPSSAATLAHQGSLLALGANSFTVHQDYDNASFGVGNGFDRRAAVSGGGLILAAGSTQQTLSGALLQGGDTASATLMLPNIRVGQGGVTAEFSIHNFGTGGPSLRGALQNTGISNAGLSGSGVTAQNWGAIAQGSASAPFVVSFDPAFGQALSGQTLQVVNNFDNVAGQTLAITGSAYNLASASPATPNPVVFANQREGGSLSQALSISNLAPANGFSESLNASISGSGPVLASGSFSLLAAGASNSTALVVGLDTSSAGAKAGTATIQLASDGTGSSGFGALGVGTQTINVVGNIYRLASASAATPNPVVLAHQRVGDAATQALTIGNTALADGFSEALNVSISGSGAVNTSGSVNQLAAGATSSNLFVGLDTSSAGAKAGTATLALASDGTGNSGFGALGIGSQTVNVSGSVFRLASAGVASPNPVMLANQRVGGGLTQELSLANTAAADGFSESLNASIAATGDTSAGGSFSLLAAGATSTALHVGVDTSTAGAKSGSAVLTLASDGTGSSGFGALYISTQTVNVSGNVYRLAQPVVDHTPIVLAARVGDAAPQRSVAVSNSGADLYTERLNASWASAPAGWVAGGAVNGLGQGGSSQNLSLGLATGASGSFAGTAQVALVSSGAGTTEAPDAALGQAAVPLTGRVYAPAVAEVLTPAVNFGIVRVGDVVATRHVSLGNTANGALNDSLHATLAGGAVPFAASGAAVVAAGGLDDTSLGVQLSTAQAGVFNSTATLSLSSHNADLAELGLGETTVLLQAQVNQLAEAGLALAGGTANLAGGAAAYTLNFGTLALGGNALGATLNLSNLTLGTADALAGHWDLTAIGPGSSFTLSGFGSFAGLAAGSSLGGLSVLFDSGSEGHFEQVIVLRSLSTNGSGPDLALGDVSLTLQGTVVAVPEPGTWLLMAGGLLLLARRARTAPRPAAAKHCGKR